MFLNKNVTNVANVNFCSMILDGELFVQSYHTVEYHLGVCTNARV